MDIETMSVRSDESGESSMWESEVKCYLFHGVLACQGTLRGQFQELRLTGQSTYSSDPSILFYILIMGYSNAFHGTTSLQLP